LEVVAAERLRGIYWRGNNRRCFGPSPGVVADLALDANVNEVSAPSYYGLRRTEKGVAASAKFVIDTTRLALAPEGAVARISCAPALLDNGSNAANAHAANRV